QTDSTPIWTIEAFLAEVRQHYEVASAPAWAYEVTSAVGARTRVTTTQNLQGKKPLILMRGLHMAVSDLVGTPATSAVDYWRDSPRQQPFDFIEEFGSSQELRHNYKVYAPHYDTWRSIDYNARHVCNLLRHTSQI